MNTLQLCVLCFILCGTSFASGKFLVFGEYENFLCIDNQYGEAHLLDYAYFDHTVNWCTMAIQTDEHTAVFQQCAHVDNCTIDWNASNCFNTTFLLDKCSEVKTYFGKYAKATIVEELTPKTMPYVPKKAFLGFFYEFENCQGQLVGAQYGWHGSECQTNFPVSIQPTKIWCEGNTTYSRDCADPWCKICTGNITSSGGLETCINMNELTVCSS